MYLNYPEHLLILASRITSWVSMPAFASLVCVPVDIMSSEVGLKTCAITAGIKKYHLNFKRKNRKNDEIVLLGKTKLHTIDILTSKPLIDSNISHDKFDSVNNLFRKYNEMNKEIKNYETFTRYSK